MRRIAGLMLSAALVTVALGTGCARNAATEPLVPNVPAEQAAVKQLVHDSIGWALTKDLDLLYGMMAQDEDLRIINPDSHPTFGFQDFRKFAETFWMDPRFKATRFEVRDLRITLSRSGTVAWYSCHLDDFCQWDGRVMGWENARWTGVAEKRDGVWRNAQMHFSFPTDREGAPEEETMEERDGMIPVLQMEDRDALEAARKHMEDLGYRARISPFKELPESLHQDWMTPANGGYLFYLEQDRLEPAMELLGQFFGYRGEEESEPDSHE